MLSKWRTHITLLYNVECYSGKIRYTFFVWNNLFINCIYNLKYHFNLLNVIYIILFYAFTYDFNIILCFWVRIKNVIKKHFLQKLWRFLERGLFDAFGAPRNARWWSIVAGGRPPPPTNYPNLYGSPATRKLFFIQNYFFPKSKKGPKSLRWVRSNNLSIVFYSYYSNR